MQKCCDIVEIQDEKMDFSKQLGNEKLFTLYNLCGNIKVWKKWQMKMFLV